MYQFREVNGIREFLIEWFGEDLIIPSISENEISFFQKGDKMTVNTETGVMTWEPLKPGEMFTSKLSLRVHQWFAKGIIRPI